MHVQFSEDLCGVQKVGVIQNLLDVEREEWQIEQKRNPIPIDKK